MYKMVSAMIKIYTIAHINIVVVVFVAVAVFIMAKIIGFFFREFSFIFMIFCYHLWLNCVGRRARCSSMWFFLFFSKRNTAKSTAAHKFSCNIENWSPLSLSMFIVFLFHDCARSSWCFTAACNDIHMILLDLFAAI